MLNLVTRQDVAIARVEQPDVPTMFFIHMIKHKNTISNRNQLGVRGPDVPACEVGCDLL